MEDPYYKRVVETQQRFCGFLKDQILLVDIDEDNGQCGIIRKSTGNATLRNTSDYQYIQYKGYRILFDKLVALHHFGYIGKTFGVIFKNGNHWDYRKENMKITYAQEKTANFTYSIEDVLSEETVLEIRSTYYTRNISMREFAKKYNITSYILYRILNLKAYPNAVPDNYAELATTGCSCTGVRTRSFSVQEVQMYRKLYNDGAITINEVAYAKNVQRQSAFSMLMGFTYKDVK